MPSTSDQLTDEAKRATELLRGKVVARILRSREGEALVEFTDGTRLFVDGLDGALELTISGD